MCNPMLFVMADPAFTSRHLINILEDYLKVAIVTTTPEKDISKVTINKLMVFAAQGSGEQTTFKEFKKARDQKLLESKAKVKSIQDLINQSLK